jgi:hypothetical protein
MKHDTSRTSVETEAIGLNPKKAESSPLGHN